VSVKQKSAEVWSFAMSSLGKDRFCGSRVGADDCSAG